MAIWRGIGGSGESTNDSTIAIQTELLLDTETARDAAVVAQNNAAASALVAEGQATDAASSANTASIQADNAATSASNAAAYASSADSSAVAAASSATSAASSASAAAASVASIDTATIVRTNTTQTISGAKTFSSPAVISVNSASTALRVTQVGAGNALLVEDSTNPDSTPFVIDASGREILGYTSPLTVNNYAGNPTVPARQQIATSGASTSTLQAQFADTNYAVGTITAKSRGTTVGDYTVVNNGDRLYSLNIQGADGTAFIPAADISAYVDGTPGTNDMPGRLVFSTTADGGSSPTERMWIDSTGQTKFSYNTVVEVTDNTNAALRITQTGTGNALLVEDSTNPDSTPLVIDSQGRAVVGYTAALSVNDISGFSRTPNLQVQGLGGSLSAAYLGSWSNNDAQPSQLIFGKSKSGTVGTNGIVASGTDIGAVVFSADDGTALIPATIIAAEVDGTPGTNDMPGRLVFSTTADGASTPTERMRIDSAGVQRQFGPLVVSNTLANNVTYNFSFDVSGQDAGASSIAFRPDGKMMYVLGTGSDDITYYSLSTAWDITTATHVGQSNSTSAQNGTPSGMFFKPDGTKVFIVGTTAPAGVWAYSCAAPWDVSTLTYDSVTYDLSAITTAPLGVWFKPDGTKMYVASNTGGVATYTDTILEYSLSTAWLVSSATLTTYFSVASQDTAPAGVQFTEDGLRMFVCGQTGDTVVVYDLSTAWDINTATFKYETSNLSTLIGTAITPTDIFIQPNGQTLYVLSDTGSGAGTNMVYQFTAASPATINLTGNTTISGNTTVNQDLTVRGATNLQTNPTLSNGTANGVLYLNGSKVATSGSALTFDGSALSASGNITSGGVLQALTTVQSSSGADLSLNANGLNRDIIYKVNATELMRLVGSSGSLGIGTSSPSSKLTVSGVIESTTGGIKFPDGTTQTTSATFATGAVRAWVNFNGTGTVAIRASGNVSSITDNGTGDYTMNFTTALADANYSPVGCSFQTGNSGIQGVTGGTNYSLSSSSFRFFTRTTVGAYDPDVVSVSIIR